MKLNSLKPATGSKPSRKRVGRGIGSTLGKTCGRGHKGQKSRSGGYHKLGFEGGQMPLQRRLPKFGFSSRKGKYVDEIRLQELGKLPEGTIVSLDSLREFGLINSAVNHVKLIAKGVVEKKFTISKIGITKGARLAIENAGGKVEE